MTAATQKNNPVSPQQPTETITSSSKGSKYQNGNNQVNTKQPQVPTKF
jgi:hypothetical protein